MLRFLRYTLEFVAAFVGFIILLVAVLSWRLSSSPITADFMTPYIESGIEGLVPGSIAHVGGSLMTWDNIDHSVSLHADMIKVDDEAGAEIAVIPSLDTKISIFGLLLGQFLPKELIIDHPQVKLERDKTGVFEFAGMAMSDGDTQSQEPPQQSARDVLRNISRRLSHAALMHRLAVTRAVFEIHDDMTQSDWAVSVPEISVTRTGLGGLDRESSHAFEFGALDGRMTIEVTQKDAVATLNVRYVYDPRKDEHTFSTDFTDLTPAFMAGGHPETLGLGAAKIVDLPVTGKAELTLDRNLDIAAANVQIHGDAGHLVYADFWDDPCPVKSFDLTADYDRDTHRLRLSDTKIDFNGPTLALAVNGAPPSKPGQDVDFTAVLQVENLPMNRYGELWPKPILPDPRYWLAADLRDGTFTHAEATLKGSLAWNDLANLSVAEGGGKMSAAGASVTYLDGLPPAENVSAEATFDLKKMSIQILGGGIGNIRMAPFTMEITGLSDPDQAIDIPLQVAGPIPEIMRLLDHQPLGYAAKLGVAPDDINGTLQGTVDFKFPLLKTVEMKDIKVEATAAATGVASNKIAPGVALDQGNLALTLDMDGFNLKGQANIGKVPFQVAWQETFEPRPGKYLRQATFTGSVADDQWQGLGISAFAGTKGPVQVAVEIDKPVKTKTETSATLDMTQAAVELDLLGWKKPANTPATLKFTTSAVEGKPVDITSFELQGGGADVAGTGSLSPDVTQLLSLDMPKMVVGRTNAELHFSQTFGADGALKFEATGKSLDVSGLRGGNDPARADPRPKEYHIKVDRLYTASVGVVNQAQGFASRDKEGWSAISLHGIVGDGKPLTLELTPQPDGHRTLAISCNDFGAAMQGLGFTSTIKGGKLSVKGQSTTGQPRLIEGKIKITSFTVNDLPVLALLLNATSPFGFGGIITDSDDFSRFEGEFNWQGDALTLTRAYASGNAIGINIDGKVDMNTGEANLQGTLVPFTTVNKLLNYIPLIGGLLTGGENQGILAASYQIKGNLAKPDISVNPVSLLAPGFLRDLFFREDTDEDKADDKQDDDQQ